ncbi:MAG TPA: carboxypeptidase-like regulatory domain-containing protein, partial [Bryobacteraceae bacterium]|nr:carboxypeptidase-like regulatory domain-containing protein [Bryobacteraceae bacterium]
MRTQFVRVAIFAAVCCFFAAAQVERASIVGTVTDKSGAVVPEALVRVTSEATNTTIELTTGESGNYSAPNL